MELFTQITIVIILAALFGIFTHFLRQPVLTGFIMAGLLISAFGFIPGDQLVVVEHLSKIGVTFLLFLVGLEMNFNELKHVGKTAILTSVGQMVCTCGCGFLLAVALGFNTVTALYIGLGLTFSSTIIVVKLLSEKKDLNSLYGRIVVGFLLMQDFVAMAVIIVLAGLQKGGFGWPMVQTSIKGFLFIIAIMLLSKILPKFLDKIAKSGELLYLFSLAWALGIASLAGSAFIGLTIETGGFLAGLALARSSEHFQIGSRLKPLRDFFIILFFVALGAQVFVGSNGATFMEILNPLIIPVIAFSAFVSIINPLFILIIMSIMGHKSRTSFLASLAVTQISEFSLILVAAGASYGHIDRSIVSLMTFVCIVTIFISSYLIIYGEKLYHKLYPVVKHFEIVTENDFEMRGMDAKILDHHVVLIGVDRMGHTIMRALQDMKEEFIALDFDPVIVRELSAQNIPIIYGDMSDGEIQELLFLFHARIIISTVPNMDQNLALIHALRVRNSKAKIILTTDNERQAKELYEAGADYVLLPHFVGGLEISHMIRKDAHLGQLEEIKNRDLAILQENLNRS
jgi:Kef-type K+ transport system membrane component KefB/voltage-gated potassium channel Kch